MANDEHVALLKQGVDAWNVWREENPDIRPDLILIPQEEPGMFDFIRKFPWVLEPYRYETQVHLLSNLGTSVLDPAEAKVLELRGATRG
jgi:hypothetical protein